MRNVWVLRRKRERRSQRDGLLLKGGGTVLGARCHLACGMTGDSCAIFWLECMGREFAATFPEDAAPGSESELTMLSGPWGMDCSGPAFQIFHSGPRVVR